MLSSVQAYNVKHDLFQTGDRIILAVSGGKDSMCLLHVMQQLPVELLVAHCNFQLRGDESDEDENFVRAYCEQHQLDFRTIRFDTAAISKERKQSIQVVARELRYAWLEELRVQEKAQAIATAHHLQDNIETLIFNLSKGTGLKGVRGMLGRNGFLIRPMLEVPLQEIFAYVKANKLSYREDSSNSKLHYDRNKIRQEVIPVLKELNPSLDNSFIDHFTRWQSIERMYDGALAVWRKELFEQRKGHTYISIKKIQRYPFFDNLLYELLAPYGFNSSTVNDILESLSDSSLKEFKGNGHVLYKDRKFLMLQDLNELDEQSHFSILAKQKKLELPNDELVKIQTKPIDKLSKFNKDASWLYLDKSKLLFPLFVRHWKAGDYFYPHGLVKSSGKIGKKKVGKFLRDEKLDALSRKNAYVVVSGQHIVAVLGSRIDARFAVDSSTKEVLVMHKK